MKAPDTRTAAHMVLRAWIESGSEQPLRVRVHMPGRPDITDRYFSDADEVARMVEGWLAELQAATTA